MDPVKRRTEGIAALRVAFVDGLEHAARDSIRIGEHGRAGRGRPGWWVNECTGLGSDLTQDDLDRVIEFHTAGGIDPKIVLFDDVGDEAIGRCDDAGFVLREVETAYAIWVRDADLPDRPTTVHAVSDEEKADDAAIASFVTAKERAFENDETYTLDPATMRDWLHVLRRPSYDSFAVEVDGETAACGSIGVASRPGLPKVALLFAGGVRQPYRRRGLHRDLIVARLHHARDAGCDLAVTVGPLAEQTARTAVRLGMVPLVTILTLVRPRGNDTR